MVKKFSNTDWLNALVTIIVTPIWLSFIGFELFGFLLTLIHLFDFGNLTLPFLIVKFLLALAWIPLGITAIALTIAFPWILKCLIK